LFKRREKKRREKKQPTEKKKEERRKATQSLASDTDNHSTDDNNHVIIADSVVVDSSDSESVSGADDDDEMIEIPQHMVNAIKEAVQQEVQDLSSSSSILPTIGEEIATPMEVIPSEGNDHENDSILETTDEPILQDKSRPSKRKETEIPSNTTVELEKNKKPNDVRVPRSNKSKVPVTGGMQTSKSKPSLPTTRMDKVTSDEGNTLPPTARRRRSLGDENNPATNTELKRSESAEVKLTVPLQEKPISDQSTESIATVLEPVVRSSEEQQTREDKNLAALMTIRKLKEAKLRKSQSAMLETTTSFNIFTDGEQERTDRSSSTPKTEVGKEKETLLSEPVITTTFEDVDDRAKSAKQFPQEVPIPSEAIQREHEQNLIVSNSVVDEPFLSARRTDKESHDDEEKNEERQEREFLPLFNESSGIFISNYEPEQLPGLSAWKLVCSPFLSSTLFSSFVLFSCLLFCRTKSQTAFTIGKWIYPAIIQWRRSNPDQRFSITDPRNEGYVILFLFLLSVSDVFVFAVCLLEYSFGIDFNC
jgi:hypothetical protein